jgi:hypothetical protein
MKIEVDFPVITQGLAVRSRAEKLVVARQTMKVDIPEYSTAEALIAFVITREWAADPRLTGNVIRAVNGNLFASARHVTIENGRIHHRFASSGGGQSYDIHGALDSKISHLLATLREKHSTGIVSAVIPAQLAEMMLTSVASLPDRTFEIPRLEDLPLKEYDHVALDDQVAKFEQHMAQFAIIDGKIHKAEREPVYVVTMPANRKASICSASIPHSEHPDTRFHSSAAILFRAGASLEEMSREIHEVSQAFGETEPLEIEASGRVHVYDDRFISFDPEIANMRLVAKNALKGFIATSSRPKMPFNHNKLSEFLLSLPLEDFLAYRELERSMGVNDPDSIADALPHFARFQPGVGHRGSQRHSEIMIERVLEKWANRGVPELVVRNLIENR